MKTTSTKSQKMTQHKPQVETIDDWSGVEPLPKSGAQSKERAAAGNGRVLPWRKSGKARVPEVDPPSARSSKAKVPEVDPPPAGSSAIPPGLYAQEVFKALEASKSGVAAVECYRDEGWPWVQVSYDETISPAHVRSAGEAIQKVVGPLGCQALFQMLRPQSIYFIIGKPLTPQINFDPKLEAESYGVSLDELHDAGWW